MGQPVTFAIPPGTEPKKCRGCPAQVYWVVTASGRRMPVEADGISHFARCPEATAFRKAR